MLCDQCLQQLSLSSSPCFYCSRRYHPLPRHEAEPRPHCFECRSNLKKYGLPSVCTVCQCSCAFQSKFARDFDSSPICTHCTSCIKRYGQPVICSNCKERTAFDKHKGSQ